MNVQTLNVLLIEDDPCYADFVCRIFQEKSNQFRIDVVQKLQEAKSYLDEFHPDLIIADLCLPDGKGIELLYNGKVKDKIPMVIITGLGSEEDAVKAMKAGALDYIIKTQENSFYLPHIAKRTLKQWDDITRQRLTESLLQKSQNDLEETIRLRTAKLENENIKLRSEIEKLEQEINSLKMKT